MLILYAFKITNNLYSGIWSSLSLYYLLRCVDYFQNYWIVFTLALVILSGVIKSIILLSLRKYWNKTFSFYVGVLLNLIPLMLVKYCCFSQGKLNRSNSTIMILLNLGFFSVDGEQIFYFKKLNRVFSKNIIVDNDKKYMLKRLGYYFQGIGGLGFLYFLSFHHKYQTFDEQIRIRQLFAIVYLIGIINITIQIICSILVRQYGQFLSIQMNNFERQQQQKLLEIESNKSEQLNNKIYFQLKIDNKSINIIQIEKKSKIFFDRYHYKKIIFAVGNGICFGLVSAPYIVYFLDVKLDFYHDETGLILFCFFILKGIGGQCIQRMKNHQNLLYNLSLVSNLLLILIGLFPSLQLIIYILLFCFFMWNYNSIFLYQNISHLQDNDESLFTMQFWQRIGVSIGVGASSISFYLLYTNVFFAAPFLLCGLLRLIIVFVMKFTYKESNNIQTQSQNKNSDIKKQIQFSQNKQQSNQISINHIKRYILLLIIMVIVFIQFFNQNYLHRFNNKILYSFGKLTKSKFIPNMKLYNQSIAHYLVKQNITKIQLVDCQQLCQWNYRQRDEYYSMLEYLQANPEWLHFPKMAYTSSSILSKIKLISQQNSKLKGFSISWANIRRYNKAVYKIRDLIIEFAAKYNFHYNQMPSLNLFTLQGQIIMIFSRQQSKLRKQPQLIKKIPPKNYLGIKTTFKLITNILYLRQYIIYHLNIGFDKIFLYDNNRNPYDSQLYKQNRNPSNYFKQCLYIQYNQSYQIFQQIWQQFYDHIIYVPWLINNLQLQQRSNAYYTVYFQTITKFTAFPDLDQFVFTPKLKYIPDYLQELLQKQYTAISMKMHPFISRYCGDKRLVIEQYWTIHEVYNFNKKDILLNRMIGSYGIHGKYIINGRRCEDCQQIHDIKLMHYNIVNKITDTWLKRDESMKIYVQQLKQSCRNKCSNIFQLTCQKQKYIKYCQN